MIYGLDLICVFRKPDSLENIVWLTIRSNAIFFGGKIPDYGLRPLFISDKK
jgi:hypothetical protein